MLFLWAEKRGWNRMIGNYNDKCVDKINFQYIE